MNKLISLFIVIVLASCSGNEQDEVVDAEVLHSGSFFAGGSFDTQRNVTVLASQEDYEEYLAARSNDATVNIDFQNNQVVVVDAPNLDPSYSLALSDNPIRDNSDFVELDVELGPVDTNLITLLEGIFGSS